MKPSDRISEISGEIEPYKERAPDDWDTLVAQFMKRYHADISAILQYLDEQYELEHKDDKS